MNLVPEFDPLFFSEAALRMRGYRQQILASNMANIDTPGYKSRDVLFSQALREQLEGTAYSNALPLASTVDVETERSHFADNALRTEAAMTMLNSVIASRRLALTGNQ